MWEAKRVGFAVVWGETMLKFELLWRMYGGEQEAEEEEQRGERGMSGQGVAGRRRKEKVRA